MSKIHTKKERNATGVLFSDHPVYGDCPPVSTRLKLKTQNKSVYLCILTGQKAIHKAVSNIQAEKDQHDEHK